MTRPVRRWVGSTLTVRAVLVTCLVALVSVLITAAVALPLAARSANEEMRLVLADKARVAANVIEGANTPAAQANEDNRGKKVVATLRAQGVDAVLIRDGKATTAGLPKAVVNQIANGQAVSQ